ncbi:MAG: hypothetical protein KF857_05740 [Fimbriimonadaceae bacterium]|nr:hypothetical protein [Fimbriimonadaceae bacterium]
MPLRRVTPTTFLVIKRRMATENFVVCPLCGALNVIENEECFVCAWHGAFDDDPSLVESQLDEIVRRCPGLVRTQPNVAPARFFHTLIHRLRALFRRPLNIEA